MRLLATAILLVATSAPAQAVEVSNFRSGLACPNTSAGDNKNGWICHVTEDILVTDQGSCRYNGQDRPCTWVGFEFDYRGAKAGDELECVVKQSQPSAFGNPNEELAKNATSQQFSLPLEKGEGHFYNPQYFTFTARLPNATLVINTGRCSFKGKSLFEYTYRLRFPELPKRGPGA